MEDGIATACFSTGMAAIAATFIALLRAGDHVVSSSFLFGNTNSLFGTFNTLGCEISFVDATDVDNVTRAHPAQHADGIRGNHRQSAHPDRRPRAHRRAVRERGLLYFVDNTMTSPYLYLPKRHQAGLVINSLTKCIGGHGNALGGAVTDTGLFDWTRFPEHLRQLQEREARDCGEFSRYARRDCATWAARLRPSRRTASRWAPKRWRCGWSDAATTRCSSRASWPRIRR